MNCNGIKYGLGIIASMLFHSLGAQNAISGNVFDANTMKPIAEVSIFSANEELLATTNDSGNFEMNISNKSGLLFKKRGYEDFFKLVDMQNNLEIPMQNIIVNISEIKINKRSYNSSIAEIDLNLKPAKSAQDLLKLVPGLFIAQHQGGGKAEQIFLRGFDIDHGTDILLTVDGMPVNMVSHAHGQGYADLHFLIPELVKKIDFDKGPYNAEKGNFATAGYVDFQTTDYFQKNKIVFEYGQFQTQRLLLLANLFKHSRSNAIFAFEGLKSNGPFELPQNFNRINAYTKWNCLLNRNTKLQFTSSFFTSQWKASGQIPERAVQNGTIGRFGAIDSNEGGKTSRINFSVSTTTKIGTSQFQQKMFYAKYDFNLFSNFTFFLKDSLNGDQIKQAEKRDMVVYQNSMNNSIKIAKQQFAIGSGLYFRLDCVQNAELSHTFLRTKLIDPLQLGNITEMNSAIFTKISHTGAKWKYDLGLRLDHIGFYYANKLEVQNSGYNKALVLSPKLVVYRILNDFASLYLKAGKGFHSNDTRLVISKTNQNILPAAYSLDLGTTLKIGKSALLNVGIWYLKSNQEFVYVGDEGITEPNGRSRRIGMDVSARIQWFKALYSDVNLNICNPQYLDEKRAENYIPLAPLTTATSGIYYVTKTGITAGLQGRYMANRPANETNTIVAKGYLVADANCTYQWRRLELGVVVENVFNTRWNEAQFATESRLKNESTPTTEIHFTPGTPIFAKLKCTLTF